MQILERAKHFQNKLTVLMLSFPLFSSVLSPICWTCSLPFSATFEIYINLALNTGGYDILNFMNSGPISQNFLGSQTFWEHSIIFPVLRIYYNTRFSYPPRKSSMVIITCLGGLHAWHARYPPKVRKILKKDLIY